MPGIGITVGPTTLTWWLQQGVTLAHREHEIADRLTHEAIQAKSRDPQGQGNLGEAWPSSSTISIQEHCFQCL